MLGISPVGMQQAQGLQSSTSKTHSQSFGILQEYVGIDEKDVKRYGLDKRPGVSYSGVDVVPKKSSEGVLQKLMKIFKK